MTEKLDSIIAKGLISNDSKFVEKYNLGCEIVYSIRSSRITDTFFKRFTAGRFIYENSRR